jgi:hypothetical protein
MRKRIFSFEKRAQQKYLIMKEIPFFPEREYVGKFPFQWGEGYLTLKRKPSKYLFSLKEMPSFYRRGVGKYPFL